MVFEFDGYTDRDSVLHRWDPRYKIIALMILIFVFSFVKDLRLLPAMLAASGVLFFMSGLSLSFLLDRIRLPGIFLLVMVLILPFVSGSTVLFHVGALAVKKEGCLAVLLISVRFLCILTLAVTLFSTMPFVTALKAMQSLGLPALLAEMTLLSYRYIFEIGGSLRTMEMAVRTRGFQRRRLRDYRTFAFLAGSILVRSYEQSDRVYNAMSLRGYGQAQGKESFREEFQDYMTNPALLAAVLLAAAAFAALEVCL